MKRIGLALGGGSAKGCAHVGVIQALQEADIPIHVVTGTSIGSLIGGIYAAGAFEKLITLSDEIDWQMVIKHLDIAYPRQGMMSGKRVQKFLEDMIDIQKIEDLPIPYAAIATDIETAEEVQFTSGNLIQAIRASISLPAIFTPVKHENRYLVDGGLVNPVPVNAAKQLGADIVIAVDLNFGKNRIEEKPSTTTKNLNFFEQLKSELQQTSDKAIQQWREWTNSNGPAMFDLLGWSVNIMQEQITEKNLQTHPADILIRPELGHIRGVDFHKAKEMVKIGYEVTNKQMDDIRRLLSSD